MDSVLPIVNRTDPNGLMSHLRIVADFTVYGPPLVTSGTTSAVITLVQTLFSSRDHKAVWRFVSHGHTLARPSRGYSRLRIQSTLMRTR